MRPERQRAQVSYRRCGVRGHRRRRPRVHGNRARDDNGHIPSHHDERRSDPAEFELVPHLRPVETGRLGQPDPRRAEPDLPGLPGGTCEGVQRVAERSPAATAQQSTSDRAGRGGRVRPARGVPGRAGRAWGLGNADPDDCVRQPCESHDGASLGARERDGVASRHRRWTLASDTARVGRERLDRALRSGAWRRVGMVVRAAGREHDQSARSSRAPRPSGGPPGPRIRSRARRVRHDFIRPGARCAGLGR